MFAKLYETKIGQILVKRDSDEEGECVELFFQSKGFGVCSTAIREAVGTEEEIIDHLDEVFNRIEEDKALDICSRVISNFNLEGWFYELNANS